MRSISSTICPAVAEYPVAPISSHHSWEQGAPPTAVRKSMPFSLIFLTMSFWATSVVVIRAEEAMTSALYFLAASRNWSVLTSVPRSMTL